jgi:hypothetical protein
MFLDDYIKQALDEKRRENVMGAAKDAATSGGLTGALLGAGSSFLSGQRSVPKMLARAAALGLGTGAMTGAGTLIGSSLLGAPDEGEQGGFTKRAGVGGAIGGGLLGAGFGALMGSGAGGKVLKALQKLPGYGRAAAVASKELPIDNLATDVLKKWARTPGSSAAKKSAAFLGAGGAGLGGALGASEGMQVDYLQSSGAADPEEEARRRRGAALVGGIAGGIGGGFS